MTSSFTAQGLLTAFLLALTALAMVLGVGAGGRPLNSRNETDTPTASRTTSPSLAETPSLTASPTLTQAATRSASRSASASPSPSATRSLTHTTTPTGSGTQTSATSTQTSSPTISLTSSTTRSDSTSQSESPSATASVTLPPTRTGTYSNTHSFSSTGTQSPTGTGSISNTHSFSSTETQSPTGTGSISNTHSLSSTETLPPTRTETYSRTRSFSSTGTQSPSRTLTISNTDSRSSTGTLPPTPSISHSNSHSPSGSISATSTSSFSVSSSASLSASLTLSTSISVSESMSLSGGSASRSTSWSLSVSQSLSASVSVSQTVSTSISVSNSESFSVSLSASDSLSTSESTSESTTQSQSASASLSASDSTSQSDTTSLTGSGSITPSGGTPTSTAEATISVSLSHSASSSATGTESTSQTTTVSASLPLTVSDSLTSSVTSSQSATMSLSLSESASVSVSTSASLTMSSSTSASATATHTVSASLTGEATQSMSVSTSLTSSITATQSTSLSASATTTMSFSTSVEPTASQSATESATATESLTETRSASLTTTSSQTLSITETLPLTDTLTLSTSFTISKSVTHGTPSLSLPITMTISDELRWEDVGAVFWLHRPVIYAAPFAALPVQPQLMFMIRRDPRPAVHEHTYRNPIGLYCYVKTDHPHVVVEGQRTAPLRQSICTFQSLSIGLLAGRFGSNISGGALSAPTTVQLTICVNTTVTFNPYILVHPCNTTIVRLASCPLLRREVVFNISVNTAIVGEVLETIVTGNSFPYALRHDMRCLLSRPHLVRTRSVRRNATLDTSQRVTAAVPAEFIDLCHVLCRFTPADYGPLLLLPTRGDARPTHGALAGLLTVEVDGERAPPTCSAQWPVQRPFTTHPCAQQLTERQEALRAIQPGASAAAAALHHLPNYERPYPVSGCAVRILGAPDAGSLVFSPPTFAFTVFSNPVVEVDGAIAVHFCDAAGNSVAYPADLPAPSFAAPLQSASLAANRTLAVFSQLTVNSPTMSNTACGDAGQNLTFQPIAVFGPMRMPLADALASRDLTQTPSYCLRVAGGNAVALAIRNEAAMAEIADTGAPLHITPILDAFDSVGQRLHSVPPGSAIDIKVTVLSTEESDLADPALSKLQVNGEPVALTMTTYRHNAIGEFPFAFGGIQLVSAGTGFGLMFEIVGIPQSRIVLWEGAGRFPVNRSMTVSACPPHHVATGVFKAEYTVNVSLCQGPAAPRTFVNRIYATPPADAAGANVVTVFGWKFEYADRDDIWCHFTTATSPFYVGVEGLKGTYQSSCRALCPIPHTFPVSQSGRLVYNSIGLIVDRDELGFRPGELRVQFSRAVPWSNPILVDAVGSPSAVRVSGWNQFSYDRRPTVVFAPFSVMVVDQLGNGLDAMDHEARLVQVISPPRGLIQLNQTSMVDFRTRTCRPASGVALVEGMFVLDPEFGDYSLIVQSPGLASSPLLLNIRNMQTTIDHQMRIYNREPLSYVLVSNDPQTRGRLPVQPQLAVYERLPGDVGFRDTPDRNISDWGIIATVTALNPNRVGVEQERGVNERGCNAELGNCERFYLGVASFRTLRFDGIRGEQYRITFTMTNTTFGALNSSMRVNTVSFDVEVPSCPSELTGLGDDAIRAQLWENYNSSLVSSSRGVVIKGWVFEPPDPLNFANTSYSCSFRGVVFPARFVDLCTLYCFVIDPASTGRRLPATGEAGSYRGFRVQQNVGHPIVDSCDASGVPVRPEMDCCFNGTNAICRQPVTDDLFVLLPQRQIISTQTNASAGRFTFIGPPTIAKVVSNVASRRTLFDNEQLIHSEEAVKLDAFIVSLFDSMGNEVGVTDELIGTAHLSRFDFVPQSKLLVPVAGERLTELQIGGDVDPANPTTCFLNKSTQLNVSGTTSVAVVNGFASFEDVYLHAPSAGRYAIRIRINHPSVTSAAAGGVFNATFFLNVVPGPIRSLCLFTPWQEVQVGREGEIPQPLLYLLDIAGNIFQPLRADQNLTDRFPLSDFSLQASTLVVRARHRTRPLATSGSAGAWTRVPFSPTYEAQAAYVEPRFVGLFTVQFQNMIVNATFGREYMIEFEAREDATSLVTNRLTTPPFLLRNCAPDEFGWGNSSQCFPCPRGINHCFGGQLDRCFICNGTTTLRVAENYWRASENSVFAYHCPTGNCIGNTVLGECRREAQPGSPLCGVCAEGHAMDFLQNCIECEAPWVSIVVIILTLIIVVVVLSAFVLLTLKEQESEDADQTLVMLIKIFVNFVQVTGMLGEFQVNFPGYVLSYFNGVSAASGGSGISISPVNCLFPQWTFLVKMDIQLLMPAAVLLVLAVVLFVLSKKRQWEDERSIREFGCPKVSERKPLFQVFSTASIILIFIMYQPIVTQCVTAFRCEIYKVTAVPNDEIRVLHADSRIECVGDGYEVHTAVAMYGLTVYGFIIPIAAMNIIMKVVQREGWDAAYHQFAFLIKGFRLRFWFWEFVIVFRKILIRLLLATVRDATLQALLGIWSLTALFVVHSFTQPYVLPMLNRAESISLITAVATLNAGLLFRATQQLTGERCGRMCGAMSIVVIILNVVVLLYFLIRIGRGIYDKIVEEFGIDRNDGSRIVSLRNIKRRFFEAIGKTERNSPTFASYSPRCRNRRAAKAILERSFFEDDGSDAGSDAGSGALHDPEDAEYDFAGSNPQGRPERDVQQRRARDLERMRLRQQLAERDAQRSVEGEEEQSETYEPPHLIEPFPRPRQSMQDGGGAFSAEAQAPSRLQPEAALTPLATGVPDPSERGRAASTTTKPLSAPRRRLQREELLLPPSLLAQLDDGTFDEFERRYGLAARRGSDGEDGEELATVAPVSGSSSSGEEDDDYTALVMRSMRPPREGESSGRAPGGSEPPSMGGMSGPVLVLRQEEVGSNASTGSRSSAQRSGGGGSTTSAEAGTATGGSPPVPLRAGPPPSFTSSAEISLRATGRRAAAAPTGDDGDVEMQSLPPLPPPRLVVRHEDAHDARSLAIQPAAEAERRRPVVEPPHEDGDIRELERIETAAREAFERKRRMDELI